MATPTPSKQPHQQEMTPGSFANHLAAFSPLPHPTRSVAQSPAHLSKKSPANAATLQHHHTGSTNSAGPLTFDSPSAAALGLNLNIPTLESVTSGNVRGDDDERRRRIESILAMLKTRPGRVSEEGVERLAKRTGLEYLWEGQVGGPRMLSIAGTGVLIDVDFKDHAVTNVAISFLKSPEAPTVPAPKAAEILLRELKPPKGLSPINTSLTPFAAHLERLARLDKLSSPGLNCFEAISGVYASLTRLFDWEKRKVKESAKDMDQEAVQVEVLCKRSGRPVMHARKRVGLSLEYWMRRRFVSSKPRSSRPVNGTVPPIDSTAARELSPDEDESDIWAAVIECEHSPAGLYPSVRISEDWLSEKVEKAPEEQDELFGAGSGPIIDWLEPAPTLLSDPGPDAMAVDSGQQNMGKLPDVRFVARMEPPVVVPLPVAYEIYNAVGIQIPQESLRATTFDGLLLENSETAGQEAEIREIRRERTLVVHDETGHAEERRHRYTLYVPKQDYGRVIEEIPFSHPRQLVAILPILRQYALLSSLVRGTLSQDGSNPAKHEPSMDVAPSPTGVVEVVEESNAAPEEAELEALMSEALMSEAALDTFKDGDALPIDISLSTDQGPKLTLVFPCQGKLLNAVFELDREGGIVVVGQNIFGNEDHAMGEAGDRGDGDGSHAKGKRKRLSGAGVARSLMISEDLGILAELIRRRLK